VGENSGVGTARTVPNQAITDRGEDMATPTHSKRSSLSVRTRFEIFKRDNFTCRYCGQRSPDVILEVDHIVPVCDGGTDDPINLATSCWACNHGKAYVPLNELLVGEDPTERAVLIAERERQLREYNEVLKTDRQRREDQAQDLVNEFCRLTGYEFMLNEDWLWVVEELKRTPYELILDKLHAAARSSAPKRFWMRYAKTCVRRWREEGF